MENLKLLELTNFTYTDDIRLVDLALMLSDFEDDEIKKVCDALEDQYLARVLEEADQKVQKKIMYSIDSDRALRVFSFMSKDDIVDVLDVINTGLRKELINKMKTGDKKLITDLLGYKDDSAGGIMTTEYIALYRRFTVSQAIQAIEKIKEIAPKTEHIETIYVMNNKKKIVGTVSLRDLLVADHNDALEDLMNPNFIYVDPDLDQEEVARIVSKYDLNAIPVINNQKVMLGIITVDEEQTEDILKMGGVDKEETLDSTILQSVRRRLPWLLVNLATAFLASFTIKAFEGIIAQVVALSATMTIIAGMGGNAGSQTVSIIIRSLAMGKVKFNEVKKLILKEWSCSWSNYRNNCFYNVWKCLSWINYLLSNDWKSNNLRILWINNSNYSRKTTYRSSNIFIYILNNSNRCIRLLPILRTSKLILTKINIVKRTLSFKGVFFILYLVYFYSLMI